MRHTPGPWRTYNEAGSLAVYAICSEHGESVRHVTIAQQLRPCDALLIAAAPDLLSALRMQADYVMRDGSPCACPAGRDEDESRGTMPIVHSTACEMLRVTLAKVDKLR